MGRKPEYLSPSALMQYRKDKDEYFRRYLCESRAPKIPQTPPMAVGSAFDAFCKSYLYEKFGRPKNAGEASKYERQVLFDSQVEAYNRQTVWEYGEHLFEMYKASGGLADLVVELGKAIDEPRFEIDLRGTIQGDPLDEGAGSGESKSGIERHINGVTLLGKPDIRFINEQAAHVVLDWKVNGFLSKSPVSPKPGYVQLREQEKSIGKTSGGWIRRGPHKNAFIMQNHGMSLNNTNLEDIDKDWATQLATYGWLLGERPGNIIVVGIEQFCGNKDNLRLASHRCVIGRKFQMDLLSDYIDLWNIIHDPKGLYLFRDLTRDDSLVKQQQMEKQVAMLSTTTDSTAAWILAQGREGPRW